MVSLSTIVTVSDSQASTTRVTTRTTVERRSVTVRDVATMAGVALSSASRVMTGHPNVSSQMRERVMAAAQTLGYEPDLVARTLRTGSSHTLGFLVADLANPISSQVISGAEDYATAHGYGLLLTNSEGEPHLDVANLELFLRRRVDGIILLTADGGAEVEQALRQAKVPVVVLDRDTVRGSRFSGIYFDHSHGMYEATRHLLDGGHERIAFIGGPATLRPVRERLDGFTRALRERDLLQPEHLLRLGSLRTAFGRTETLDLLGAQDPPTAIVVGGNQLLAGVLDAIHSLERLVGRDIALVSCDDVDLTRLYRPAISSVVRDVYRAGQIAAELVLEQLAEPDAPVRSVLLPTSFLARGSSVLAND